MHFNTPEVYKGVVRDIETFIATVAALGLGRDDRERTDRARDQPLARLTILFRHRLLLKFYLPNL